MNRKHFPYYMFAVSLGHLWQTSFFISPNFLVNKLFFFNC
jgi:hypothetical protein